MAATATSRDLQFILKMKDEASKALTVFTGNVGQAAKSLNVFGDGSAYLAKQNKELAKSTLDFNDMITKSTLAVVALWGAMKPLQATLHAWSEFEDMMQKFSASMPAEEVHALGEALGELSKRVPMAETALADIAYQVNRLGVGGSEDIIRVTEHMARFGTVTGMNATEATQSMREMIRAYGEAPETIEHVADAAAILSKNSGLSAEELLGSANAMTRSLSAYHIGTETTLALAATFETLGLRVMTAGSSFSQLVQSMAEASRKNGSGLNDLAKVMGTTVKSAKDLIQLHPEQAALKFAQGITELQSRGIDTTKVLTEFGLQGNEVVRMLISLGENAGMVGRNMTDANRASAKFLNDQSAATYQTLTSKVILLGNAWSDLLQAFGEQSQAHIKDTLGVLTDGINGLTEGFKSLVPWAKDLAADLLNVVSAVLGITVAIRLMGTAMGLAVTAATFGWVAGAVIVLVGLAMAYKDVTQSIEDMDTARALSAAKNGRGETWSEYLTEQDPRHTSRGAVIANAFNERYYKVGQTSGNAFTQAFENQILTGFSDTAFAQDSISQFISDWKAAGESAAAAAQEGAGGGGAEAPDPARTAYLEGLAAETRDLERQREAVNQLGLARAISNAISEAQLELDKQHIADGTQQVALDKEQTAAIVEKTTAMYNLQHAQQSAAISAQEFFQKYSEEALNTGAAVKSMLGTITQSLESGLSQAMASGFENMITQASGFKETFLSIIHSMVMQILQEFIRLFIIKQIMGAIMPGGGLFAGGLASGGVVGGGGASAPMTGWDASWITSGPVNYAKGGVFDSPHFFKFAKGGRMMNGVMGEAGPEAVMPLQRDSQGRLGLKGGGTTNVNVSPTINVSVGDQGGGGTADPQAAAKFGTALDAAVRKTVMDHIQRESRPGGMLRGRN